MIDTEKAASYYPHSGPINMYFWITFFLLLINWVVFSGLFDSFHLGLGIFSSLLVAWTTNDLLFKQKDRPLLSRLPEAGRFIGYCGWLLYQILLANIHVIALALFRDYRNQELDPHIFTFRTRLRTDFARFVLANSITLTPGTITIRIEDDHFYVHAVSRKAAADLPEGQNMSQMEKRVAAVFEPELLAGS